MKELADKVEAMQIRCCEYNDLLKNEFTMENKLAAVEFLTEQFRQIHELRQQFSNRYKAAAPIPDRDDLELKQMYLAMNECLRGVKASSDEILYYVPPPAATPPPPAAE